MNPISPDAAPSSDVPAFSRAPEFHEESGAVRFWVLIDGALIGASISRQTLHYRYRPLERNEDPLQTYMSFALDIDEAVRRRVAKGSREPVMLREYDLGQS